MLRIRFPYAALAALALASIITWSGQAGAATVTHSASFGNVRALLTAVEKTEFGRTLYDLTRLRIYRRGRLAFDGPLPEEEAQAYGFGTGLANVLDVRELDADGEPEVMITIYTGGAHCCTHSVIYGYAKSTGKYVGFETNWGDGGFALKELDRDPYPEFVSTDDRFAYAFASYAGSGRPLLVMRYRRLRLVDVTLCYPALIRQEAQTFWASALQQKKDPYGEPNGVLAPYVADEYQLGNGAAAMGRLRAFPSADARFRAGLLSLLKQGGYLSTKRPDCAE